jgi:hypothetical protein
MITWGDITIGLAGGLIIGLLCALHLGDGAAVAGLILGYWWGRFVFWNPHG